MTRPPTIRQFYALAFLAHGGPATAGDLPMARDTARSVLAALARKGWAEEHAFGAYSITAEGEKALQSAREQAEREAAR